MPATEPIWGFPYLLATDPPDIPGATQGLATAVGKKAQLRVVSTPTDVPVAERYFGMIVFATTTLLLYRWDGANFVALGSDKPVCKAVLTGTQSIPNNADTDIAWSGAVENWSDGTPMWDAANPTRVVIRKPGYYRCKAEEHWAIGGAGTKRAMTITRNNTGIPINASAVGHGDRASDTVITNTVAASGGVRCDVGDIIRVSTYQNNGGALNLVGNAIEGVCFIEVIWEKP